MSTGLVLFECARELARDPQGDRMRERIIPAHLTGAGQPGAAGMRQPGIQVNRHPTSGVAPRS